MRYSLYLFLVTFFVIGCGKKAKLEVPQYTEMKNVSEAPEVLQTAAHAIFRLSAGSAEGTGSFITRDGLILTNNHVLGVDDLECAAEGCHIQIYRDYQIGTRFVAAQNVYAVPVGVSPEWDASLFQLYTSETKTTKVTSDYSLSFSSLTGAQLKDKRVHIIGHPLGSVKKWTSGTVYQIHGDWFSTTAFGLPGNSGSPYLDDEGRIVGLLHRGVFGHNQITRHELLTTSIGTPSAQVVSLVVTPKNQNLFLSVTARYPAKEIAERQDAYYRAHVREAILPDGTRKPVLDILGDACDEGLKIAARSPGDLETKIQACSSALTWINCNDASDGHSYKSCPVADKAKWTDRFAMAAEKFRAFSSNQAIDYASGPSRLEDNHEKALTVVKAQLASFTGRSVLPLSFDLATRWISVFGVTATYQGERPQDLILNYRSQPNYQFQYGAVIQGHILLTRQGVLNGGELGTAFTDFFSDEKLDLGNKLQLESVAYRAGYFE